MCGICGITWNDKKLIKQIIKFISHRGPDQEGYFSDKNVTLGHKRLSIIDLSSFGKQPMKSINNNIIIVFNGEIYNYQKIKNELKNKRYKFKTKTDTEVIINAYKEWGVDCVKKFNGQFAFCIYDKKKNELFLARDRLGMKPLCYYHENKRFIFASELKCIIKLNIVKKEISKEALNHYLLFGYTPLNLTILKNVKKLKPGHYIIYDLKKKEIKDYQKYWDVNIKLNNKIKEKEIIDIVTKKLNKSIERRMISDRPVGAFLSGGVDSSLIVSFMRKKIKKLETFSVSFDRAKYDESKYARKVSKMLNTKHHEIKFSAKDIKKWINKINNYFDEPFSDASTIPTYLLAKVAKKNVTIGLSGTGGDELFGGYTRYYHFNKLRLITYLPSLVRIPIYITLKFFGMFNKKLQKASLLFWEKEYCWSLYPKLFSFFDKKELNIDSGSIFNKFKKYFRKKSVYGAFVFDQKEYIPNDLLFKEDICCMANSLEGRFPFLDHELVEFANNIPKKYKLKHGQTKVLLKKLAEKYLPKSIIYRKKQSFSVPFAEYFRNELKEFAYELIFNFNDYDYYNKKIIRKCWKKHQKGKKNYANLFLSLLMFNLWYKKWMK